MCTTGASNQAERERERVSIKTRNVCILYQCSKVKKLFSELEQYRCCGSARDQMSRLWGDSN